MAIKPPSDIVLDVVRAADPARQRVAAEKLKGAVGAEPVREFADLVGGLRSAGASGTCGVQAADAGKTEVPDAFRAFEAFFVQSFVQSMLPKNADAVYGSGTAGDVWRSQLAEKMGTEIAKAGGIGIADRLLAQGARTPSAVPADGGQGFSLSDSLSEAAPFAGWESYLPFLPGRTAERQPGPSAAEDPTSADEV